MLRNVKELQGFSIHAADGIVGEVDDLYFDDEWAVRYLVADTGSWLSGRKVLISPLAIGRLDWMTQQLAVSLSKARVEGSPDIDTGKPVSRQHEAAYFGYYGYPVYWGGTTDDSHVRSCRALIGNPVHATDGDIGHVQDLLVDDHSWAIRYLIVDTSHGWGGHNVLISPQWIKAMSRSEAKVSVDLTRQAVKDAPPYDSAAQLDRQQEQAIYEHYGHPGYWTSQAIRDAAQQVPD